MSEIFIGIDIEEISRFENKTLENDETFLKRVFSVEEIEYCFAKKNPSQHLCARFCAKEAVVKALSDKSLSFNQIKILNEQDGKPVLELPFPYKNLQSQVSLSHCSTYACANVLIIKD